MGSEPDVCVGQLGHQYAAGILPGSVLRRYALSCNSQRVAVKVGCKINNLLIYQITLNQRIVDSNPTRPTI